MFALLVTLSRVFPTIHFQLEKPCLAVTTCGFVREKLREAMSQLKRHCSELAGVMGNDVFRTKMK